MKPTHFNFVIFLCFATVHICSGYKPLRGTQGNTVPAPIDPEHPPAEHGKSVYDPDIYNKYTGIQFEDQIVEEEPEKDASPNMPSYPWRGGGHVPMPLDDPEAVNATKKVEYLIGFRDCDEILGDSPDVFKDDEEDDEAEEEEEKVDAEREAQGGKSCRKKEYPDDDSEIETSKEEGEEEEEVAAEDTEDEEIEEDEEQTSESEKKCPGCSGRQDTSSFALRGVGAVSVTGKDYLDDALVNPADDTLGGGDQPDHYYPYSDDQDTSSFALRGVGSAPVTGKDYLDNGLAPTTNPTDDTFGGGDQPDPFYPYSDDLYVDQDTNSFALRGVGAASVTGKDYLDNGLSPNANAADDSPFGGGDQADEHYYPYSDDMYGEATQGGGQEAGADVVAILDGGSSSEPPGHAARGYVYRPDDDGDSDGESEEALLRRRLGAEGCRVCVPCCVLLAGEQAEAPERRARAGECTPDDGERDFVGAECRSCHVRRRPPPLGVVLTCYECAAQQADRTCRLGRENVEHSHYRVSAKFFLTAQSNHTGVVTATQHAGMLARQPHTLPAQQMTARASGSGHTLSTPSFIDSDNKDLYPFEVDEAGKDDAAAQAQGEHEAGDEEEKEAEEKKGKFKLKHKKK